MPFSYHVLLIIMVKLGFFLFCRKIIKFRKNKKMLKNCRFRLAHMSSLTHLFHFLFPFFSPLILSTRTTTREKVYYDEVFDWIFHEFWRKNLPFDGNGLAKKTLVELEFWPACQNFDKNIWQIDNPSKCILI